MTKFRDAIDEAEERLDAAAQPEHPRRYAGSNSPETDPRALAAQTRREVDGVVGGPGLPFMSRPMWNGLVGGSLVGGAIGAIVLLPLAFIPMDDVAIWLRILVVAIIGAVAGGTAGALYWGGRTPELSGESLDADNTPSAGSSLADPHSDARGR